LGGGELFDYVNQQPSPSDAAQVKLTLKYLETCSKIFEKGLLSHDCVFNTSTSFGILESIQDGYVVGIEVLHRQLEVSIFTNINLYMTEYCSIQTNQYRQTNFWHGKVSIELGWEIAFYVIYYSLGFTWDLCAYRMEVGGWMSSCHSDSNTTPK